MSSVTGAIDRKEGDRRTTRNCSYSTDPVYDTPTYGLGRVAVGQQSGGTGFLQGVVLQMQIIAKVDNVCVISTRHKSENVPNASSSRPSENSIISARQYVVCLLALGGSPRDFAQKNGQCAYAQSAPVRGHFIIRALKGTHTCGITGNVWCIAREREYRATLGSACTDAHRPA